MYACQTKIINNNAEVFIEKTEVVYLKKCSLSYVVVWYSVAIWFMAWTKKITTVGFNGENILEMWTSVIKQKHQSHGNCLVNM